MISRILAQLGAFLEMIAQIKRVSSKKILVRVQKIHERLFLTQDFEAVGKRKHQSVKKIQKVH
jgi:hypothetical protein